MSSSSALSDSSGGISGESCSRRSSPRSASRAILPTTRVSAIEAGKRWGWDRTNSETLLAMSGHPCA